jgi:mannose-6-phosphate isomerase-like protein (cupin superfamily)
VEVGGQFPINVPEGDERCRDITQFFGLIAPGRAPMHSHIYDEIVYIIDGEGILPPLVEHCLENTGKGSMEY